MTVALLVSMIVSFWMSEPADLISQHATKGFKQVVERIPGVELTPSCHMSFEEFSTTRTDWNANTLVTDPGSARAN